MLDDTALSRIDAAISKVEGFVSRTDDLSNYGFSEADHPRDENGKFTSGNGAAAHGIAAYKKSLGYGSKGSGSGLMQFMIKSGHYSEKDILKAWNTHSGGTTASAVKGQINLLKKAGYNPPPLPNESAVPSLKKMQETASSPSTAKPAAEMLAKTHPEPATAPTQEEKPATTELPKPTIPNSLTQQKMFEAAEKSDWKVVAAMTEDAISPSAQEYGTKLLSMKPSDGAEEKSEFPVPTTSYQSHLLSLAKSGMWAQITHEAENSFIAGNKEFATKLLATKSGGAPKPAAALATNYESAKAKIQSEHVGANLALAGLFENYDKITPENKVKVDQKLIEIANSIGDLEAINHITPLAGYGQSISAVNSAISSLQSGVSAPAKSAPIKSIVAAQPSPRLTRMKTAFDKAKRFASSKSEGAKEVCPTLKSEFWQSVPSSQHAAAKYYTGSGYTAINSALRTWETEDVSPHLVKQINDIDELFDHPDATLKEDAILKRGEQVPTEVIAKWEKALTKGLPCRYMKDGFISASMASNAAFKNKNVIFEIVARKGTPAVGLATISSFGKENEVLMRHGQNFEIFEIENKHGSHVVRMVAI